MEGVYSSNFLFMKDINGEIYRLLNDAERKARIDIRESGRLTRAALEEFIQSVLRDYQTFFEDEMSKTSTLDEKMRMLKSVGELKRRGYLKPGENLQGNNILPNLGRVEYVQEDGKLSRMNYDDYLRVFGNVCSHSSIKINEPKDNYGNLIKCLMGHHNLLTAYYSEKTAKNMKRFDENLMPIGEFEIEKSYVPDDSHRSKCLREFYGYSIDYDRDPEFYAIIRMYNKQNSDHNFMLRNHKAFTEASKNSYSSVPEGMTRLRQLTSRESEASPYYMIAYIFNRKPYALKNSLLKTMSLPQRIQLCSRIVDCLYDLQSTENQIYHRMLNYDCVYVTEFREQWIPYIIKFDYAKIVADKPIGTVKADADRAQKGTKEEKLKKYFPPEWDYLDADSTNKDWEKVDLYSLGVLFSDILLGEFKDEFVDLDLLEEIGVPEDLLKILESMQSQLPQKRCDMELVKVFFDEVKR